MPHLQTLSQGTKLAIPDPATPQANPIAGVPATPSGTQTRPSQRTLQPQLTIFDLGHPPYVVYPSPSVEAVRVSPENTNRARWLSLDGLLNLISFVPLPVIHTAVWPSLEI